MPYMKEVFHFPGGMEIKNITPGGWAERKQEIQTRQKQNRLYKNGNARRAKEKLYRVILTNSKEMTGDWILPTGIRHRIRKKPKAESGNSCGT